MSAGARIAIVGSGPSGFYAAEALLRSGRDVRVDIFERLPMPYGLVRYGVAPDHQKLKSVTAVFERIAAMPGCRWWGGVHVGRDITIDELQARCDAVVIAAGAASARRLEVPGEALDGVCTSSDFVAWTNGHPDCAGAAPPLSLHAHTAVVLGHGNVAIDVTRLLSKTPHALATSDVPARVLEAFATSRVRTVHLVGRSAPGRAKFTPKELRELGELPQVRVSLAQGAQRVLDALRSDPGNPDLLPVWQAFARHECADATREIRIWFGLGVERFAGERRLDAVHLQVTDRAFATADDACELRAGHAVSCIGYRSEPIAGVPFDAQRGVVPNVLGRVHDGNGRAVPGLFVTGWIKRGPTGIIGTNRADSLETVGAILEDWPGLLHTGKRDADDLPALLEARGVRVFPFIDWQRLDAFEKARAREGAPREKLLSREEALAALGEGR